MTFSKRIISLQFQLGQGDFGEAGTDTVTLEGLRCSVDIVRAGIAFGQAQIRIWGMPLDLMKRLTVTRQFYIERRVNNRVAIEVGGENGMGTCFIGTVWDAWVDARNAPDVSFNVGATSSLLATSKPVPPLSFKGAVDIGLALTTIADQIGYRFENSGVTGTLQNPYKPGTLRAQIDSLCRDVGCSYDLDESKKVLAIWPKNGTRGGQNIRISSDTGLVGYPSFTQGGLQFTTLYNPDITFGSNISMDSIVPAANGDWSVMGLAHRLDANIPGGQWFTDVECIYPGFAA